MPLGVVFIERQQFLLRGLGKQRMAVLPQEHKQLGPTDALDDGVCRRRQFDWGMPRGGRMGSPPLETEKRCMST
jgi:hypothetical protein